MRMPAISTYLPTQNQIRSLPKNPKVLVIVALAVTAFALYGIKVLWTYRYKTNFLKELQDAIQNDDVKQLENLRTRDREVLIDLLRTKGDLLLKAIDKSAETGKTDVLNFVIDYGAILSAERENSQSLPPLMYVVERHPNNLQLIRWLLAHEKVYLIMMGAKNDNVLTHAAKHLQGVIRLEVIQLIVNDKHSHLSSFQDHSTLFEVVKGCWLINPETTKHIIDKMVEKHARLGRHDDLLQLPIDAQAYLITKFPNRR